MAETANNQRSLVSLNRQRPGYLRINDIEFDIPPKNIIIQNTEYSNDIPVLRSASAYTVKSGHKTLKVTIALSLDIGENGINFSSGTVFTKKELKDLNITEETKKGWGVLSKLLIQVRKYPIVTVENEKIRKELLHGFIDFLSGQEAKIIKGKSHIQNMTFIMDGIQVETDRGNPNLLNVLLNLSFFNFFPYSLSFNYIKTLKEASENGTPLFEKSILPTKDFYNFYTMNTLAKGSETILINNPGTMDSKNLEIVYKTYDFIGSESFSKKYPEIKVQDLMEKTKQSLKNRSKHDPYHPALYEIKQSLFNKTKARKDGWILATSGTVTEETQFVVFRWNTFKIEADSDPHASGNLFVQDAGFTYFNNVAYIPMAKYDLPTAQFLGGSQATLRLVLYAAPEITHTKRGLFIPTSTSNRLGALQALLDEIKNNALKYPAYAKNDVILLKHPFAKILKYTDIQSDEKIEVFDPSSHNNKLTPINTDDFLPCVVKDRISQTIEGSPFASQLQLDFVENKMVRKNQKNIQREERVGQEDNKNDIEEVLNILLQDYGVMITNQTPDKNEPFGELYNIKEMAQEYNNQKTEKKRYFNSANIDARGALKVQEALEGNKNPVTMIVEDIVERINKVCLMIKPYSTVQEAISDPILDQSEEEILAEVQKERGWIIEEDGYISPITGIRIGEKKIKQLKNYFEIDIVNRDYFNKQAIKVLSLANSHRDDDWAKPFIKFVDQILLRETMDIDTLYPDMKLNKNITSPLFHIYHDHSFYKLVPGYLKYFLKYIYSGREDLLNQYYHDKDAIKNAAKNNPKIIIPEDTNIEANPSGISENVVNIVKDKDSIGLEDKRALSHINSLPKHRLFNGINSVLGIKGLGRSLDQTLPVCRITLINKDGRLDLDEETIKELLSLTSDRFNLSEIMNVRIIKKEDNPVDLAVIRLVGMHNNKINNYTEDKSHEAIMEALKYKHTFAQADKASKRFIEAGIKEGTRIQIRMGYAAKYEDLPVEFNGRIASVTDGDVIEIIAAGNGEELIKELKYPLEAESRSYNSNTYHLIRKLLLDSPELKSFGTLYPTWKDFELQFLPAFIGGKTALDNIFAPNLFPSMFPNGGDYFQDGDILYKWVAGGIDVATEYLSATILMSSVIGSAAGLMLNAGETTFVKAMARSLGTAGARKILSGGALSTVENFTLKAGELLGKTFLNKNALGYASKKVAGTAITDMATVAALGEGTAVATGAAATAGAIAGAALPFIAGAVGIALTAYTIYDLTNSIFGSSLFGSKTYLYRMTIWDVLQEMTLRHPGTICAVVPYGDRSTIYFGEPHQMYYYRHLTLEEMGVSQIHDDPDINGQTVADQVGLDKFNLDNLTEKHNFNQKNRETKADFIFKKSTDNNEEKTPEELRAIMTKNFREYHYVSSISHIIQNNIKATSKGVYNEVRVAYPESNDEDYFTGTEGISDFKMTTVAADDDINPDFIKVKDYTFPNAHPDTVKDLPFRYSKSLLVKNLEKVYQGKLIIRGRPEIKPHDVVMLHDDHLQMNGPVGVREVVQIFDSQRGWITEITPKLMVFPEGSAGPEQLSMVRQLSYFLNSEEKIALYDKLALYYPSFCNTLDGDTLCSATIALQALNQSISDDPNRFLVKEKERWTDSKMQLAGVNVAAYAFEDAADIAGAYMIPGAVSGIEAIVKDTAVSMGEIAAKNSSKFAKALPMAFTAGKAVLSSVTTIAMPLLAIQLGDFVESKIEAFVNYTKYRQPVIFYPLMKNGAPFIAGMKGFKNNTILEHFGEELQKAENVFDYVYTSAGIFYDRITGEE